MSLSKKSESIRPDYNLIPILLRCLNYNGLAPAALSEQERKASAGGARAEQKEGKANITEINIPVGAWKQRKRSSRDRQEPALRLLHVREIETKIKNRIYGHNRNSRHYSSLNAKNFHNSLRSLKALRQLASQETPLSPSRFR